MARNEPKVGTKGPTKTGGTGGGMSKESVAAAAAAAARPAAPTPTKRVVVDTTRNDKAMKEM